MIYPSIVTVVVIGVVSFLMIYLVLRNASDAIPTHEAHLEPIGPKDENEMALGGLAAVQENVEERPIVNPDEPASDGEKNETEANPESGDVSEDKTGD